MLQRGPYGVEYVPKPEHEGSGGFGWIVVVVVVLALVSLSWTLLKRYRDRAAEEAVEEPVPAAVVVRPDAPPVLASAVASNAVTPVSAVASAATPAVPSAVPPSARPGRSIVTLPQGVRDSLPDRPVKLRNLLTRLDRAETLDMAVTTLELLREQPQAADLDRWMATELGRLNLRRLMARNPKWVREVTAKRGDSISRIASDHNCTQASLRLLNGSRIDRIRVGDTLYVMSNPDFTLVVDRRSRTADLKLGPRFFKRYDLVKPVPKSVQKGLYKTTKAVGGTLRELGISVSSDDLRELELLLPKGSSVTISEE